MLTRKGFSGAAIATVVAVVTGCASKSKSKPKAKTECIGYKVMTAGTHEFRIIGDVHLCDLRSLERVRLSAEDMESVLKHGMSTHYMIGDVCITGKARVTAAPARLG